MRVLSGYSAALLNKLWSSSRLSITGFRREHRQPQLFRIIPCGDEDCTFRYQIGKFLGAAAVWLAMLIVPLIIFPGWITIIWLLIAVCGSVWGIRRYAKKKQAAAASQKDGNNAWGSNQLVRPHTTTRLISILAAKNISNYPISLCRMRGPKSGCHSALRSSRSAVALYAACF